MKKTLASIFATLAVLSVVGVKDLNNLDGELGENVGRMIVEAGKRFSQLHTQPQEPKYIGKTVKAYGPTLMEQALGKPMFGEPDLRREIKQEPDPEPTLINPYTGEPFNRSNLVNPYTGKPFKRPDKTSYRHVTPYVK